MTLQEWHAVRELIRALWRNAPTSTDEQVAMQHRIVKAVTQPDAIAAVESYAATGAAFPPEPGQILREATALTEPAEPTFDEMLQVLFFATHSPLYDRPAQRIGNAAARILAEWAEDDAHLDGAGVEVETTRPAMTVAEQCAELHPLIESFVSVQTPERLRSLPVADEDEGKWAIMNLRAAWLAHRDAYSGRERRAVVAGRLSGGPLRRVDPAAVIGLPAPAALDGTGW